MNQRGIKKQTSQLWVIYTTRVLLPVAIGKAVAGVYHMSQLDIAIVWNYS